MRRVAMTRSDPSRSSTRSGSASSGRPMLVTKNEASIGAVTRVRGTVRSLPSRVTTVAETAARSSVEP